MGGSGGPWGPWGPRLPVSGEGSAQRPPSDRAAAGTRLSAASAGGPGAGTQGSGGLSELRWPFASPDAPQSGRCPRGDGRRPALSKGKC